MEGSEAAAPIAHSYYIDHKSRAIAPRGFETAPEGVFLMISPIFPWDRATPWSKFGNATLHDGDPKPPCIGVDEDADHGGPH
jgi:hypothetical protein